VPVRRETTFFTRHGHVFVHAVSLVALALVSVAMLEPRLRAKANRNQPLVTAKSKKKKPQ
jgi:hypothetical protein